MPIPLVAHRGYQKHYPENTLLAFRKAIEAGAVWLETDIQLSADGEPLLYHDRDLKRLSGMKGRLSDLTLEQALAINAAESSRLGPQFAAEHIASLAQLSELMLEFPEVSAFIEIKRSCLELHSIDTVLDAVTRVLEPLRARCILISFNYPVIEAARKRGWPQCGVVLQRWKDVRHPQVIRIRPDFVFCNIDRLPARRPYERSFSTLATRWVIYEIDQPQKARELYEQGAAMVETFAVGEMLQALTDSH